MNHPRLQSDPIPITDSEHQSDHELVSAALSGDNGSLVKLTQEHLTRVPSFVRLIARRCGAFLSPDEAPDLIQDCLVVVWRRLPSYRGEASLDTWIYRVCQFELLNGIRRLEKQRLRWKPLLDLDPEKVEVAVDGATQQWVALELEEALSKLEPDERTAIRLRHYEGQTMEGVAEKLEISYSQARTLYCRALRSLHRLISSTQAEGAS